MRLLLLSYICVCTSGFRPYASQCQARGVGLIHSPIYCHAMRSRLRLSVEGSLEEMPRRWKLVPDEQRPARWQQNKLAEESKDVASTGVREIDKISQLLSACKSNDKLVILKLYSKRCRACKMIAPKYRSLARKNAGSINCFEAEADSARPLVQALRVSSLPTIVIFDPIQLTRIYSCSCAPAEFKAVESKVASAIRCMQRRPLLLRQLGEPFLERLLQSATSNGPKSDALPKPTCICVDESGARVAQCIPLPVHRSSTAEGAWLPALKGFDV